MMKYFMMGSGTTPIKITFVWVPRNHFPIFYSLVGPGYQLAEGHFVNCP